MGNFLKWGSWLCALSAVSCGAGERQSDSAPLGVRTSALEPVVGAEIGTDTPALTATDLGHNPVVASDGSGFLAVQEVDARIRAVRVDANGKVLDGTWLDFGQGSEAQYYPSVAFGAGHYFVTWSVLDAESTVRGRFVRPDGSLEGTAAFTLSSGQALYPSVGWTGSQFLVSWLALGDSGSAVTIAAFDSSGSKVANSEHTISGRGSLAYPRIAVGSRRALVTWEKYLHDDVTGDVGRIYGALVEGNGAPVGDGEFALSNSASSETTASIAAGGSHFLVVWQTQDDPSSIFGSSIDDNGAFDSKDVTISRSTETAGQPSVVFSGSKYLVAWADGRDQQSIYGTPVSTTGGVLGTADVKLATGSPRYVAFGSDRTALAWSGSKHLLTFLGNGIEGSLIGADLQIQNGQIPLTGVANAQGYPNLTYNGVDYVVQWTDERESYSDMSVRAVRISTGGQVRDPNGLVLSTAESPAFGASLASNRNDSSLSLWSGSSGNYRRSLAADGTLGPLSPFGDPGSHPSAVAGNGSGYLAVYMTGDSSNGAVFGRLLDAAGNGATEFQIDSSTVNTGPNVFPAAGGGYLVSYSKAGTRLVSVSATGQLGTSEQLSTSISFVSGATGGNTTLVTWTDTSDAQVRARFVNAGALSGATLVLSESSAGYNAALSWDGSGYFAIWETPEHHLAGRNIAADGTLGPVTALVDEECYGPVSASNQQGQVLVSYIKYGESSRTRRIASRLIGAMVADGGAGAAGSSGAVGAAGGTATSGAAGSNGSAAGSGGTGSGTAGSATGGSAGSAGGGGQAPIVINCSVSQLAARRQSGDTAVGLGWALAALAAVFARRKQRIRRPGAR